MFTDDNGIVRFEATDNVSPLHTGLNTALSSVSDALDTFSSEIDTKIDDVRDELEGFEIGSANGGIWQKFPNGLLICSGTMRLDYDGASHYIRTITSGTSEPLPYSFVDTDYYVTATANYDDRSGPSSSNLGPVISQNRTESRMRLFMPRVTGGTDFVPGDYIYADYMAIGRWK